MTTTRSSAKPKSTKRPLNPKHAVKESEIPACVGNPRAPHKGRRGQVALNGFDNRWRCLACHNIHVELVYKEAGELGPDDLAPTNFIPVPMKVMAERAKKIAAIKRDYAKGGKYYDTPIISQAGYLVNRENVREAMAMARKMPQSFGESRQAYGDRIIHAYRELAQKRGIR